MALSSHGLRSSVLIFETTTTVKPVLSGHPRDPLSCPINRGVRLVQVHFTENKEEKWVFTEAGVHLMQGVCLIWGPLNMGSA